MKLSKANINIGINIIFILTVLSMISCASYKNHLPEKETLYTGSKVKIVDSFIESKSVLLEDLNDAIRPKTNKKIFGLRFKLGVYNFVGVPKSEKGFRKYLRDKIGEPPVLGSTFNQKHNQQILINKLQNNGYFNPEVTAHRIDDTINLTTKGAFEVLAGKRKYFRKVEFLIGDTSVLAQEIRNVANASLVKKGNPYFFNAIADERNRIDAEMKNKGYYYFSSDFLIAKIDTGANPDSLDVQFELKRDVMQPKSFDVYHIKDVFINSNYVVRTNQSNDSTDTARIRRRAANIDTVDYTYFKIIKRNKENFKPFIFKTAIHFEPGDVFSRKVQNLSLNRLVSLNAFKFVKNEMVESYDSTGRPMLSAIYLLTPHNPKILNFETSAFSQNDSRVGSRLSVAWKHRNILKGAEQLEIKVSGGFEIQYGGGAVKNPNLYQLGLESTFTVPRLLFARSIGISSNSNFIPRSNIKAGYNFYLLETAYRLNTFNLGFGYQWKESLFKDHKFYPINITFVRTDSIGSTTDYNLSNILFNGVIIGPTYQFTYTSPIAGRKDLNFYFDGLVDLSANIIGLAQGAKIGEPNKKILGANYAQYAKMQTDFRFYKTFGKESVWANRLFLGAGYAYGNSYNMPNVKQFFVGGANSLRGFRSRLLGPGTFHQDDFSNGRFLELLGDLKFELNSEIRFPLYSDWIKGAAFIDAGNIWLLREKPDMPGAQITTNFYKELAANAGIGLRFDFSIIVLRTDFGMPIRKPWMDPGKRWVFDQIDFGSAHWRKNNLVFNLAIGYPF